MDRPRLVTDFKLTHPGTVLVTATVTMDLADWKRLSRQLGLSQECTSFPAWRLVEMIRGLVAEAEARFERTFDPDDEEAR